MYKMNRNINDYSLYVFDLDGTLYDQPRLRLIMAIRLMGYYLLHPFSVKELFILQHFRKVKDSWTKGSSEEDIIKAVADDKHTDSDRIRSIVRRWIYDNPLSALKKTRDDALAGWMQELRSAGKTVVILSDYPTEDKLKALEIEVDGQYGPEDERIDELKPSPKGLQVIMKDLDILPTEVLMIGDRMEKDGMCATSAGVDYLILPRSVSKRTEYGKQI